jgi:hypothetical protein
VIFERFFSASGSLAKRREEKRREEKRRERETRTRLFSRKRRAEDLKKKKSGKRKDNRSPLVCLSQKVFGDMRQNIKIFSFELSFSVFCFPQKNNRTTKTEQKHKKTHTQTHANENETTYDANRRCRRR